jgi:hypothetical protein
VTVAGVVSVCLRLLDADPLLHHALHSLYMFGVKPMTDDDRAAYAEELAQRFRRAAAEADPVEGLVARLDLDEAIHSLVHRPPAERESWWGQVQQRARGTLDAAAEAARAAGHTVLLQALWGPYRTARSSSQNDLELDGGSAAPGEVLACLRVAARIDGRLLPGRVLYRSSRG